MAASRRGGVLFGVEVECVQTGLVGCRGVVGRKVTGGE